MLSTGVVAVLLARSVSLSGAGAGGWVSVGGGVMGDVGVTGRVSGVSADVLVVGCGVLSEVPSGSSGGAVVSEGCQKRWR